MSNNLFRVITSINGLNGTYSYMLSDKKTIKDEDNIRYEFIDEVSDDQSPMGNT